MLSSKEDIFKPIIESNQGLHLTIYLERQNDVNATKDEIRFILNAIKISLVKDMTADELQNFIQPIENILKDKDIIEQMTGNIGIFRNKSFFRVVNIPRPLNKIYQLANSFHVKPILSWLQIDKEFIILGFEQNAVHIYSASQYSLKLIDKVYLSKDSENKSILDIISFRRRLIKNIKAKQFYVDLNEKLEFLNKSLNAKIFLAGPASETEFFLKSTNEKNIVRQPISNVFNKFRITEIYLNAKKVHEQMIKKNLKQNLSEFTSEKNKNLLQKSLYHISKSVIHGKVKKLLVAENVNIYGRINRTTGEIDLHPFDLDNEDDCIIDDLAQIVLSQGGEVLILNDKEIDKKRPILAIIEH